MAHSLWSLSFVLRTGHLACGTSSIKGTGEIEIFDVNAGGLVQVKRTDYRKRLRQDEKGSELQGRGVSCLQYVQQGSAPLLIHSTVQGDLHAWDTRTQSTSWSFACRPEHGVVTSFVAESDSNFVSCGTR